MSDRIPVPGTYNLRDVGGLAAGDLHVRSGVLLRSDGLGSLGESGRNALADLGVDTVIDLRSNDEIAHSPDDLGDTGFRQVHEPIFQGTVSSQLGPDATLLGIYDTIIRENGRNVADAIRVIALDDGCVLVHCTAGKDRTGIVIALALLAVGVDRDAVVADYAETEANLAGDWLTGMRSMLAGFSVTETPQLLELLGGSPPAALNGVIDHVESQYGSAENYLLANGLTADDLTRLRTRLLE